MLALVLAGTVIVPLLVNVPPLLTVLFIRFTFEPAPMEIPWAVVNVAPLISSVLVTLGLVNVMLLADEPAFTVSVLLPARL